MVKAAGASSSRSSGNVACRISTGEVIGTSQLQNVPNSRETLTGVPVIVSELYLVWHETLGQGEKLFLDFRLQLICG